METKRFVMKQDQKTDLQRTHSDVLYFSGNFYAIDYSCLDACKTTPTTDLGDRDFFLGGNASLLVQASQLLGIKLNHIYIIDYCLGVYLPFKEGGRLHIGMFNLADGSIQSHYVGVLLSRACPPIWVTPNPCCASFDPSNPVPSFGKIFENLAKSTGVYREARCSKTSAMCGVRGRTGTRVRTQKHMCMTQVILDVQECSTCIF